MITAIALLCLAQSNPQHDVWFDRIVTAHQKLTRATITVKSTGSMADGTRLDNTIVVSYIRPDRMKATFKRGRTHRNYWVVGAKGYAEDVTYKEYVVRPLPKEALLLERAALIMPEFDDGLQAVLDANVLRTLLSHLRGVNGWRVSASGNVRTLAFSHGSGKERLSATLKLHRQTHLMQSVNMTIPAGKLNWSYSYGTPPSSLAFKPPRGAIEVESLLDRGPEPKYASPAVKQLVESSARAYDALKHGEVKTTSDLGAAHLWFSGSKLREKRAEIEWAYNGSSLYIKDLKGKRFYKGRASVGSITPVLMRLNLGPEPLLRQLTSRKNPMRALLVPGSTVRLDGSLEVGGVSYSLVSISSTAFKATAWIRNRDKLITRIENQSLDPKGNVLLRSERVIEYVSLNKPIPASRFVLTGTNPLALSRIGK